MAPFARLAYNYRWSWTPSAAGIFSRIDPYHWSSRGENPVRLMLEAPAEAIQSAAGDEGLTERARMLQGELSRELGRPVAAGSVERPVAFLCAEYGIHRSLPTYSGGLGVLAGDILKEASDMALPFVGVGILYRQGFFHQHLDRTGWQHEYWIESDTDRLPAALVTGEDGLPLLITVPLRSRQVHAQVWRVDVGRVPLFLLDAQRPENDRVDRWITARLYVGDRKTRLAQYALLGIGGMRALRAMGLDPTVVHLNEGHAALAPLELAREAMSRGRSLDEALESARARTVFTTHTPVAAGNETYFPEEVLAVLEGFPAEMGMDEQAFLNLGRHRPEAYEPFGVTVLGIRLSHRANAVSRRHGQVARGMWQHLFPGRAEDEVPIGSVTNGVHVPTWMAPPMAALLDLYLGEGWQRRAADPDTWKGIAEIPDRELWAARNELRAGLVRYVQDESVAGRLAREEPTEYAEAAAASFAPDVLTLGYARRVAGYKRLPLLTRDPSRILRLLGGEPHIQVVIAGKAHPQDEDAKRILQSVFAMKIEPPVAERVAFLQDYDLRMAAGLVAGCDVWINVPRPPLEASGTSGMKATLNGGLNLSVLDGWWEEAYDGSNGWAIEGDPTMDLVTQDHRDAAALYDILEHEVLPEFYDRDGEGVPGAWVRRIKNSLATIGPRYCATRMVGEYVNEVYELD